MQTDTDELLLDKCRKLIEDKLQWGSSDVWSNQDFETLSEKIEEATKINLSPVTLKRIWKKIKYNSKPTITTLDTLVQFMGYENWRVFKLNVAGNSDNKPVIESIRVEETGIKPVNPRIKRLLIPAGAALAVLSIAVMFFSSLKNDSVKSGSYTFSSKKIESESVPNSVIFSYNVEGANENDMVYIQQSWDERLRQQVKSNANTATSIYYYPGFFMAKLVVNEKIVKEHGIHIHTKGWLPLVEQPTVPVYFTETDVIKNNGIMALPINKLTDNTIPLQPAVPWVAFHNSREFENLMSDNFVFETELKNDYKEGAGICQYTEVHIRWEGGVLIVPLSIKGCVSSLGLFDSDGRRSDTELLGCDFSDWVQLKVVVKNRKGELFIQGNKAYDLNLDIAPAKLAAITYRFQGTGSVNFITLSTVDGNVVYENNF